MTSMEFLVLCFCVIPATVTSITISPNGNSPEVKMIGGMMVDIQKGFVPITPKSPEPLMKSNYEKSRKLSLNSTKLSINERYRRLIPYMTFYYANDLTPTTESYEKNVEVEKAEIVETPITRQPKKIIHSPYHNVPRYQGNRLSQYNIVSANPTKIYKDQLPHIYQVPRVTPNYNNYLSEHNVEGHDFKKFVHRPNNFVLPGSSFAPTTRKPYLNFFNNEDSRGVQYYLSEKVSAPKYKLVPYEQTPPVKVIHQSHSDMYDVPTKTVPVPVHFPQEQTYVKTRPQRPQYSYDASFIQPQTGRKPPAIVSESYYEKLRPQQHNIGHPVIESGFKPIMKALAVTTEASIYTSTDRDSIQSHVLENDGLPDRHNYYQYVVDEPTYRPALSNKATLGDLLNSLQLNKSVPKPITRDNVGSSIRTLLQVLNNLRALPQQNEVETTVPELSTAKPEKVIVPERKPDVEPTEAAIPNEVELHEGPYLAPVTPPSQHLDDYPTGTHDGITSQRFPLQIENDDEGGTPGRPGQDYPVLTTIPHTSFNCKTQRYKGFFADPETRCQVWHYCDLNGGQASFLCPNGTIFSQAGLTCDWWFNVRCASTTQLYVLNESLYKYILPHSPKFPEDYSGPLVDKYLTLKFKEMEEQFKKNKHKQALEKIDSDSDDDDTTSDDTSSAEDTSAPTGVDENSEVSSVSEASVVVESSGTSGNVERLHD